MEYENYINNCVKELVGVFERQGHTHYTARKTAEKFKEEILRRLGKNPEVD